MMPCFCLHPKKLHSCLPTPGALCFSISMLHSFVSQNRRQSVSTTVMEGKKPLSLSKSDSLPHMYHRTDLPPVSCIIRLGCCVNLPWKTAFPSTLWKSQPGRSLLLQRCHALLEKQGGYFIPLDFSAPAFLQPHSAMRSRAKAHPC